jgi:hypothetical protein
MMSSSCISIKYIPALCGEAIVSLVGAFLAYAYRGLLTPWSFHGCREAHDQQGCPYTHPGEGAARRDPMKFKYMSVCCPDSKAVSDSTA